MAEEAAARPGPSTRRDTPHPRPGSPSEPTSPADRAQGPASAFAELRPPQGQQGTAKRLILRVADRRWVGRLGGLLSVRHAGGVVGRKGSRSTAQKGHPFGGGAAGVGGRSASGRGVLPGEDGQVVGVVIRDAAGKGRGVYAVRDFAVGELVVRGRVERTEPRRTRHSFQKGWDLHVELDETARSINHCCSPNAGVVDNTVGGYDFVAMRPIRAGEEITWDYESTEYESIAVDSCLCGSAVCRGRTRGFKYRTDRVPYIAAYLRDGRRADG
ncbi:SET domain-containing protein [Streptomyces sp. NPDC088097]|uniref:SET domain-containing protein n=1 Tax=Streptomyces sp. NPDC088097 TaxID=3365823 RepID=UPI00381787B4